ncbi:MAG: hypothetical protein JW836_12815 [Deltaproteobacteria bacterium]|nr:hypothetical protein [Deltaproteobacteria bacterium]
MIASIVDRGNRLDENALLKQLEEVAQNLGIEVRYENLKKEGSSSLGGLCRLKGQYLLIVNSKTAGRDKIEALAAALERFDLSRFYLKPGLREFLDRRPKITTLPDSGQQEDNL